MMLVYIIHNFASDKTDFCHSTYTYFLYPFLLFQVAAVEAEVDSEDVEVEIDLTEVVVVVDSVIEVTEIVIVIVVVTEEVDLEVAVEAIEEAVVVEEVLIGKNAAHISLS